MIRGCPSTCLTWKRSLSSAAKALPNLSMTKSKATELEPIKSLDLKNKIYQIPSKQSLISMMFLGQFDIRLMAYPDILAKHEELRILLEQKDNLRQHFARTLIESIQGDTLLNYGFKDLWSMSATEGCLIFEGIGSSDYDSSALITAKEGYSKRDPVLALDFNIPIVKTIIHNYLSMSTIFESENESLKNRLKNKKVAYCFTEKHASLGVVTEYDWSAQAKRRDANTWNITGSKSFVLDDKYDEYIIFCKTTDYEQEMKYPEGYDIPPCIVAFVVPKERLEIESFSSGGITYQTLTFPDLLLTEEEHLLIRASEDNNVLIHSKRGLAQLAVSALMLGKMKSYYYNCVRILQDARQEVQNDKISQYFLMEFARKVFSLESTVYLISSMFDSFSGRDMKLEGMASKIIASKYAEQITQILPSIIGHSNVNMGSLDDYFAFWDGFLEGKLFNQLIIGLSGLRLIGPYVDENVHKGNLKAFFPKHIITEAIRGWKRKRGSNEAEKLDLATYVGADFEQEASELESLITKLKWSSEFVLHKYGRHCVSQQMEVMRLGMIPVSLLEVVAGISRSTRSSSNTLEGFDADLLLTKLNYLEKTTEVKNSFKILSEMSNVDDKYRVAINRRNMKYGGYFAFSPLDKVHY